LPVSEGATDERLHVFCHVTGGLYALGATLSAGLSLRWLRDTLAMDTDDAFSALGEMAEAVSAGADGLLFLPYLNGERTPHMDAGARGAFIGLNLKHTTAHLARAIMEGVAFSVRQAYDICVSTDTEPETRVISGGGAESSIWRQILTDVFNRPLVKSLRHEQAALGAAMLAGIGIGHYGDDPQRSMDAASQQIAQYDAPLQPDSAASRLYAERYEQFTRLYPLLKTEFHMLTNK
jgi:xylulokinase